jgi:hypothetical protein
LAQHCTQSLRAPQSERGFDLYETPPCATRALLHFERDHMPRRVWEPACGPGAISRVLEAEGFEVQSSDLFAYGYPGAVSGLDFLTVDRTHPIAIATDGIVTNPPFYLAARSAPFVARAIEIAPYVALLLRLPFLEGAGAERLKLTSGVARVYVASRRLPMMHRDGWDGPKASSAMAFAWFVWDARHRGPGQLGFFDWKQFAHDGAETGAH